jgi:hypothetical protein
VKTKEYEREPELVSVAAGVKDETAGPRDVMVT